LGKAKFQYTLFTHRTLTALVKNYEYSKKVNEYQLIHCVNVIILKIILLKIIPSCLLTFHLSFILVEQNENTFAVTEYEN
jgi:hypothetical protein